MATLLDTTVVSFLVPIFVFLLIFAAAYALLQKTGWFGGKKGFDAAIAFAVSILFAITPDATQFVTLFTPWMLVFAFVILAVFVLFMAMGVKEGDMVKNVAQDSTFITIVIIGVVILFLVALTQVFGPFLLTNTEAGFWNATKRALFHPRMLGAMFILAVSAFAIQFLASEYK